MTDALRLGAAILAGVKNETDVGRPDVGGWRTIESAPKDGTVILLWYFFNPVFKPPKPGMYAIASWGECRGGRIGWRDPFAHYEFSNDATHWMPLPAPPKDPNP